MSLPIDETHDAARTSWVASANGHPEFPIQNLPLGIFSPSGGAPRAGAAIGDRIVDLAALASAGLLPEGTAQALGGPVLNSLLGLPQAQRAALRLRLSQLLSDVAHRAAVQPHLHAAEDCELHLPAAIGDYTDFYVGIHHATAIGRLFRPDNPLLPNYKHVPIGYHGRASSVRASGVGVVRPNGQQKPPQADAPTFGPSRRLDYELELGVWVGPGNELGRPVPIGEAEARIAGLCLLNDWSARDLQAWEYQPLGPFLAKSFQTTISPWIVTAEALAPFRRRQPPRPADDPRPLPYLWSDEDQEAGAVAIQLEVSLSSARMREQGLAALRLSRGAANDAMYWTIAQLVTHHASNGCNLNPGDLLGTGTLSTADKDGWGSLMELSHGGAEPITLPGGETRTFLEDGDEIAFSALAQASGRVSIGFGPCAARILPAPAP
jgi:fumarylacetoacetase